MFSSEFSISKILAGINFSSERIADERGFTCKSNTFIELPANFPEEQRINDTLFDNYFV
jgi:hypothetical protein